MTSWVGIKNTPVGSWTLQQEIRRMLRFSRLVTWGLRRITSCLLERAFLHHLLHRNLYLPREGQEPSGPEGTWESSASLSGSSWTKVQPQGTQQSACPCKYPKIAWRSDKLQSHRLLEEEATLKLICLLISQMHKLNPREVSGFPIGVKSRLESRDSESRLESRDPDY